ncbi:MAG: aminotransferase class V-fold PLP-dependent enzyme [Candidatus Marinimicrobia bacterium]|jgi:isopenicillin-N epimerase|nr:aminotransferase class V-fold PLP-dependent enzyme [Candidatus Neomarinimicrobiota bacterium]MBT3675281.1 aminotransferase class V-fold PLP-dependent enzyme [Candidatus Neomarinimicrobiota bacterium]MBT3763266.1 aminotransferase class V-fold PLP-dependent enzyme [Candidatus Neomarinimicrobiota bacterium]MBT4068851.1 aminotransferase class V-fold PLP-dependent enzyme [Candidatus Neomarinimicrobiota bacterium]MBT4269797.1 aminotransferase class V-fold PLP-dependent enzyme [Candidatus Neomarini
MNNSSEALRPLFQLDPEITFLNHGSYGACPKPVFETYQSYQKSLESRPIQFMQETVYDLLEKSRKALGQYIHCDPDDVVFVSNPTHAVGNIINNVSLNPGDEVLTTNLEYGSCDRMWTYDANKKGYKYIQAEIKLYVVDTASFLQEFWSFASEKTKYIFISQITSSTGMILPIPEIVAEAKKRNIQTIIDGAHVPAHIPLDITDLDPDYYTGALHKWLCCPKGVSFLYVKRERQSGIEPMVKSWGWGEELDAFKSSTQLHSDSRFVNVFQWQGTQDMSAFLTVPEAIQFQDDHDWDSVRIRCKAMIQDFRNQITAMTALPKLCPDNWLGQMATILFPMDDVAKFKQMLYNDYKIEMPTMAPNGQSGFRVSINGYNTDEDVDHLLKTLKGLL